MKKNWRSGPALPHPKLNWEIKPRTSTVVELEMNQDGVAKEGMKPYVEIRPEEACLRKTLLSGMTSRVKSSSVKDVICFGPHIDVIEDFKDGFPSVRN